MTQANPFQPAAGARPPLLVGREPEIAAIDDALARLDAGSPPVSMAFLGLRGLGKTALLSEIQSRLPDRCTVIRVEVERDQPLAALTRAKIDRLRADTESFPKRLGAALDKALAYIPKISYELPEHMGSIELEAMSAEEAAKVDSGPLGEVVSIFNEALHLQRRRLVILIDEVQDADLPSLRSLAASVHQSAASVSPILFAVAGLPQAEQVFRKIRTYTQRWDHLELAFLTKAEVASAIRIPIAKSGATIEASAIDRLVEECGGYPFFVQLFSSAAWNRHSGRKVTLDDVESVIPQTRAKIEKTFYRAVLDRLTPREIAFVIALAELGPGPQQLGKIAARLGSPSERLGSIRMNLVRKDVVLSPSPRMLEFRTPLLDRYIREHREDLETDYVREYRERLIDQSREDSAET